MSSHPKYSGPGLPPGQKAAAPPPKQRQQQRPQLRADFLLNFQRPPAHQRPQAYAPPPRRSRPSARQYTPVAFTKGRFVQSSFRLYVDELTPDVVEAALNADSLLRWESVRRVDLMCEQPPKCPICLEADMIVPKITRCGHVFCAPCVMRYFIMRREYNGKTFQRCPVCNEQTSPDELTSARFEMAEALRENDRVSFVLAHRDAGSTVVRLSPADRMAGRSGTSSEPLCLPSRQDAGWHLSRLVLLEPEEARRLLEEELEALRSFRTIANSDGESEILPSIDASVALVRQRRDQHSSTASPQIVRSPSAVGDPDSEEPIAEEELMLPPPADRGEAEEEAPHEKEDAASVEEPGSTRLSAQSPQLSAGMRAGSTASSPSMAPGGRSQIVSFYQVGDGRLVFLEPFFTRLLLHEHGGRWDGLPSTLEDIRLERLHDTTVTEETRKRHKFLQHLPLGSQVYLVEVDLRAHLSNETKEYFAEEFLKRQQLRKKEQIRSRKEERLGKSRAAEEEERYYSALNLTHPTFVQVPPTAEDFAVPLPGREAEATAEGAAGATSGAVEEGNDATEEATGPTLAEKIREKMSAKAHGQRRAAAFPGLGRSAGAEGVSAGEVAAAARGASGAGSSSSAWGPGHGSSLAKKDGSAAADKVSAAAPLVGLADEQPTFGEALEAALRSAEAEQPDAAGTATGGGGKKKKGQKGKATTIRLFG
mmetsp:Transcript_52052/g.121009  ORF Transcript_52052/g.121009 Transcript_52052/m.121009 type:complete len:707 (+) Transcript_52052:181-2301(+)|eukprot:CAMPEP_0171087224 /NCGR_PEP_ID=MMETSP0766_2-20121228/20016_1 /TAXON_ID=439317 /ORGANISM="Gambierdiscus australes, Strain CAWD 149" /LENGTH=706 /DNA_ID=CAMNT_0011544915 /DNA_START=166 /DNA_END=2286 /DNA_ORIENTATION=+